MDLIQVVVLDSHEIFRRGVVACLREQADMSVAEVDPSPAALAELDLTPDVAVVADLRTIPGCLACPVLVCAANPGAVRRFERPGRVLGVLPRATLTPDQLVGAIRAVSAGLVVEVGGPETDPQLDPRSRDVLRLLAEGADTQQISEYLSCSTRTVKSVISRAEDRLGARTRAQAVARAIRDGLI